jgi:hypothetical protein
MTRRIVLLSAAAFCACAQQPEAKDIPLLLPEAADVVDKSVRAARARLFDPGGVRSLLDPPPDLAPGAKLPPPPPSTIVDLLPMPELPVKESEVVVVGSVERVQPFLTSSKSSLYTEYTIRVTDIVKSAAKVPVQDTLLIVRRGGKARLESGRVIAWDVHGEGDPYQRGQEYLLFLGYREGEAAYLVQRAWQVENGVLKAAYPGDREKASLFRSQNDGRVLTTVLRELRAAIEP